MKMLIRDILLYAVALGAVLAAAIITDGIRAKHASASPVYLSVETGQVAP